MIMVEVLYTNKFVENGEAMFSLKASLPKAMEFFASQPIDIHYLPPRDDDDSPISDCLIKIQKPMWISDTNAQQFLSHIYNRLASVGVTSVHIVMSGTEQARMSRDGVFISGTISRTRSHSGQL